MSLSFTWDRIDGGKIRIKDNRGGIHMAQLHESELIEAVEKQTLTIQSLRDEIAGMKAAFLA